MTLPLLLSVPHAGLSVPDYLARYSVLTPEEIAADGDVGARAIYALEEHVQHFVTTDVARAFLDMNRAEDDRRKDGVVKTHTCWDVPIWSESPPEHLFERLLDEHHRPYHARLSELAGRTSVAIDCHTMAAVGPPVGPDAGQRRPIACLGDGDGLCPRPLVESLQRALQSRLPGTVTINEPFRGGYITRFHGAEMPWIQLELSRDPVIDDAEKHSAVLQAFHEFCSLL